MNKHEDPNVECPISADVPDWSYEWPQQFWDPGRKLLGAIRQYQRWRNRTGPVAALMSKWHVLWHRFWSFVTGAEIPLNCQIGGGLLIPHPNGIVIHPAAKIGVNCLISAQVTIGTRVGQTAQRSRGMSRLASAPKSWVGCRLALMLKSARTPSLLPMCLLWRPRSGYPQKL